MVRGLAVLRVLVVFLCWVGLGEDVTLEWAAVVPTVAAGLGADTRIGSCTDLVPPLYLDLIGLPRLLTVSGMVLGYDASGQCQMDVDRKFEGET